MTLGMLTWNRSAVFEDAETLYRDVIARNPQAWMAYENLGTELASRNRLSEAIDAYEGALRARPGFPQAQNNLVLAHMKLGTRPPKCRTASRAPYGTTNRFFESSPITFARTTIWERS